VLATASSLLRAFDTQHHGHLDITIRGLGDIGDKAQQLLAYTGIARRVGFHTPPRLILADGVFDPLVQHLGLGSTLGEAIESHGPDDYASLQATFLDGETPWLIRNAFGLLLLPWKHDHLAVRSSGAADARGSGTYLTKFVKGSYAVPDALMEVLASAFHPDAYLIRARTGSPPTMGVIIEPVIGQRLEQPLTARVAFAPILSGFGYTSTSNGEAQIGVYPGLGGGVEAADVTRLTRSLYEEFGDPLWAFEDGFRNEYPKLISPSRDNPAHPRLWPMLNSALLGTQYGRLSKYWKMPVLNMETGALMTLSIDRQEIIDQIYLLDLFDMLTALEVAIGTPLYVEWALAFDDGDPQFWLTQIAPIRPDVDLESWGDLSNTFLMAKEVRGTGRKTCDGILFLHDPANTEALTAFNAAHSAYMLVYSSSDTATFNRIAISAISNASAIYARQSHTSSKPPFEHWRGQLDLARIFFGVIDDDAMEWGYKEGDVEELPFGDFMPGTIEVISRQAHDRAFVRRMK
jgi:hypothetical protein